MSGGHFCDGDYPYYKVSQFADELEQDILNNGKVGEPGDWYPNHDPKVIEYLKEQLPKLRKMSEIMRACDYLYSGDYGDDSFMARVKNVEKHYEEDVF